MYCRQDTSSHFCIYAVGNDKKKGEREGRKGKGREGKGSLQKRALRIIYGDQVFGMP